MTTVLLVRHGLVDNPRQVYYGRLPGFGLAEEGREQARSAGRRLAHEPIAAIYHSPMQRAVETAAIVRAEQPAAPPLLATPLLNEIHSPYDGRSVAEMEDRDWDFYSDLAGMAAPAAGAPPYETPPAVLARVLSFFELVRAAHPGQHVVGISHGDPISFAIMWACGLTPSVSQSRLLPEWGIPGNYPAPASVSTFVLAGGEETKLIDFHYQVPWRGA